jgi:hypothetical protein
MVYKISLPLVGSTGTRKKEIIDGDNNLVIDEIRVGSASQKSQAQGSTSGYTSGAFLDPVGGRVIDKFPFSTDANATDVGDTLGNTSAPTYTYDAYTAGNSSSSHGYLSGGYPDINVIQKFSFSVDGNATDVGDLTIGTYGATGTMSSSFGYVSGGHSSRDTVEKFPFSSDANGADVGNITVGRYFLTGSMSETHGYAAGGTTATSGLPNYNVIDKNPFASDANSTDVGDILGFQDEGAGASSPSHGYMAGGNEIPSPGSGPPFGDAINVIQKYSFSADANSTDVGDLTSTRYGAAGQSSTTHGYSSGGSAPATTNIIEKYPFSSDTNSTDVGDLTDARRGSSGQQV